MTGEIVRAAVVLSDVAEVALVAKATAVLMVGLLAAWLLGRAAASVRALVLVCTFAVLALLPAAALLSPPVVVSVPPAATVSFDPDAGPWVEDFPEARPMPLIDVEPAMAEADVAAPSARPSLIGVRLALLAVWLPGLMMFLAPVLAILWRLRRMRQTGVPWAAGESSAERLAADAGVRRSIAVLRHEAARVPMTCGVQRPAILLPWDAPEWSDADVERALVHEIEHVRRRDWAVQILARLVCAAYWFHPLVWMAWRQLHLSAEQACDDAVLRREEAAPYAAQLVHLAERLSEREPRPILAMAGRSDLATRVLALLDRRQSRRRAGALWAGLAVGGAAVALMTIAPVVAQQTLAFEVASIRPNDATPAFPFAMSRTVAHPGGRFEASLVSLRELIRYAYALERHQEVEGNQPVLDARFDVTARAPDGVEPADAGPFRVMLQALLADRFNLRIRWEEREQPVYHLRLARDDGALGPQIRPSECTPRHTMSLAERSAVPQERTATGRGCGNNHTINGEMEAAGQRMYDFTRVPLSALLDRPVLDSTGLDGLFDFEMQFNTRQLPPRSDWPWPGNFGDAGPDLSHFPSLFAALEEQLGLRLEPSHAAIPVLIVDHVEPLVEN